MLFDEVKRIGLDNGFECLDGEYVNADTMMTWRCLKSGHVVQKTFIVIKRGVICPECKDVSTKNLKESIFQEKKKMIENAGWEMISEKYISGRSPFMVRCPAHHQIKLYLYEITENLTCRICQRSENSTEDLMRKSILLSGVHFSSPISRKSRATCFGKNDDCIDAALWWFFQNPCTSR